MKRFFFIFLLCFGILLLVALVSAFVVKFDTGGSTQPAEQVNEGWYSSDGQAVKLDDLPIKDGAFDVFYRFPGSQDFGEDLSLISTDVRFAVLLDGREVYTYNPEILAFYGTTYGNDIHLISLADATYGSVLEIRGEALDTSMWAGFRQAYLGSGNLYIRHLIRDEMWKFLISFLTFAAGLLITLLGLFFSREKELRLETIALGIFAITISLWTVTGTYMIQIIAGNPGLVRLVNYLSLMILPASGITLVACLTGRTKSWFVFIIYIIGALDIIMHFGGMVTHTKDYHTLVPVTHVAVVLAVLFAIIMFLQSLRRKPQQGEEKNYTVLIAFGILVFTGLIDLGLFYFTDSADMARFSRFGLLLFVGILAAHELHQFIEISEKSHEIEVMDRLAHMDALTGLKNRTSLNEYEFTLKHESEGVAIFVVFDINYLKKVNDTWGHSAGDAFIRNGAAIIEQGFGEKGWIFRTGGDEFFAVIFSPEERREQELLAFYAEGEKKMSKLLKEHNEKEESPIPLQIAYGMSVYHCRQRNLEEQEQLADSRMYEHKIRLKQAEAKV
ncbi:MAG: GGDEF domain-containing protein [Eubacterium sp.]|nr:GGDEF domain-containing protein [Eubacterium sp.]